MKKPETFKNLFSPAWARRHAKAQALKTTDAGDLKMIAGAKRLLRIASRAEQKATLRGIVRDCRKRIGWRKAAKRKGQNV